MWFHFLRLYFDRGKFHGSKNRMGFGSGMRHQTQSPRKNDACGVVYDGEWSSNTAVNNMPRLVTWIHFS